MNYIDITNEMLRSLKTDVEKYISGEKSEYIYKKEIIENYGATDKNYINRTRLCYGLIYSPDKIQNKENIVRELFEEEIKSRRNESFQGIGVNLELLTIMLREFEPLDSEIFQKAKDSNYDCFCGYEPDVYEITPIKELSLSECIYIAADLNMTEYVCRLVDEFKKDELDISKLSQLRSFSKYSKRICDRELAVTGIFNYVIHSDSNDEYKLLSACKDYTELLIDQKNYNEAVKIFSEYSYVFNNYKRSGYELGMRLIQEFPECRESVWNIIYPLVISDFKNIAPVNCHPLSECAEIMGDKNLSKKLIRLYNKKIKNI